MINHINIKQKTKRMKITTCFSLLLLAALANGAKRYSKMAVK